VYDLDDGLPWDDGRLPNLGRWWKRPWPRSLIARRSATSADRVVAGNELLASWAAEHCGDVVVIPTCVDAADYVAKTSYEIADRPVIGWIGSPATQLYVSAILPALRHIANKHDAQVELIGAEPTAFASYPFVRCTPWSPATVRTAPANWDVGIMPLHDGIYERAKCGYKLLQYCAIGLPVIGSAVGVNRRLIETASGWSACTGDEWIDALCELVESSTATRRNCGDAARQVAAAHSFDAWELTWRRAVGLS
jgi:glycosyltransferase involved in cell wall biosynthesis